MGHNSRFSLSPLDFISDKSLNEQTYLPVILLALNKIAEGKAPRRVLWDPSFYKGPRQSFLCLSGAQDYHCVYVSTWPPLVSCCCHHASSSEGPSSSILGCAAPSKSWMVPRLTAVVQAHQPTGVFSAPPLASNGGSSESEFWSFQD